MEQKYFTQKDAAEEAHCCVATLKTYERAKLVSPARDSAGRPLYTPRDIERIRAIKAERVAVRQRALAEGRRRALAARKLAHA